MSKNLGKKYKVGDWFITTGKKQGEQISFGKKIKDPIRIYRPGDKAIFQKGKRKYYCEVLGITETRTGYYIGSIATPSSNLNNKMSGKRWWLFSYMVKILQN